MNDKPSARGNDPEAAGGWLNVLLETLPMTAFLGCYFLYPAPRSEAMYIAIIGTTLAMAVTTFAHRLLHGKFSSVHAVTLILLILFGGGSLLSGAKIYFLWKPTILYWLFAAALGVSNALGRPLLRPLLQKHFPLPETMWRQLTWVWAAFCVFLGVVNLLVAYYFSEAFWAAFKVFGFMTLTFLFLLAQIPFLLKSVSQPGGDMNRQISGGESDKNPLSENAMEREGGRH